MRECELNHRQLCWFSCPVAQPPAEASGWRLWFRLQVGPHHCHPMCTLHLNTRAQWSQLYITCPDPMIQHYRVWKPSLRSTRKIPQRSFDLTVLCAAHAVERPCCNGNDLFPLQTLNLSWPSDMVIRAMTQTVIVALSPVDDTTLLCNWPARCSTVESVTVLVHFTHQVYTAPDFVKATENWEPHSTFVTPSPVRESIWKWDKNKS